MGIALGHQLPNCFWELVYGSGAGQRSASVVPEAGKGEARPPAPREWMGGGLSFTEQVGSHLRCSSLE